MNHEEFISELDAYVMEKYFAKVDEKLKLDRQIEILHDAYNKIIWEQNITKINANIKWNDILRARRSELIDQMAKIRKGIPKDIMKKWKKEYAIRQCKHTETETIAIPGTDETITICHGCGNEM
jgi:hypothetical protein